MTALQTVDGAEPLVQPLAEPVVRLGTNRLLDLLSAFAHTLMGVEVDARCGAGYGQRSTQRVNSRHGYRRRTLATRAGMVQLSVPRLRSGSYQPDWLLARPEHAAGVLADAVEVGYRHGFTAAALRELLAALDGPDIPESRIGDLTAALEARLAAVREHVPVPLPLTHLPPVELPDEPRHLTTATLLGTPPPPAPPEPNTPNPDEPEPEAPVTKTDNLQTPPPETHQPKTPTAATTQSKRPATETNEPMRPTAGIDERKPPPTRTTPPEPPATAGDEPTRPTAETDERKPSKTKTARSKQAADAGDGPKRGASAGAGLGRAGAEDVGVEVGAGGGMGRRQHPVLIGAAAVILAALVCAGLCAALGGRSAAMPADLRAMMPALVSVVEMPREVTRADLLAATCGTLHDDFGHRSDVDVAALVRGMERDFGTRSIARVTDVRRGPRHSVRAQVTATAASVAAPQPARTVDVEFDTSTSPWRICAVGPGRG